LLKGEREAIYTDRGGEFKWTFGARDRIPWAIGECQFGAAADTSVDLTIETA
jgi:hypothetical protein